MDIRPDSFIKDAVVKELIKAFLNVQREEYTYLGDSYPTIKEALKGYLKRMKIELEILD